jgi:hypothetical protein
MPELTLESTLKVAIAEVQTFIIIMAGRAIAEGWNFKKCDDAPETFKDLKARALPSKIIPVATQGCGQTIYEIADTNILFRFWHDVTHLNLDCGFNLAGESAVTSTHLDAGRAWGLSPLAMRVLEADTIGQVLYYEKHKCFVINQRAWLDSCLQYGISLALGFKH